ncbi:MAG: hypothetical protein U0790_00965 [Isosphaeraceae bacterium]
MPRRAGERTRRASSEKSSTSPAGTSPPAGLPPARRLAPIGLSLQQLGARADAETTLLREALAIREKAEPRPGPPSTTARCWRGHAGSEVKYAEAEPLLLSGYEGMKAQEAAIPPPGLIRIPEAIDRLIGFHRASNRPEDVAKWRAERAKYPGACQGREEKR